MSRDVVFLLATYAVLATVFLFFRLIAVPQSRQSFVDIVSKKIPLFVLGLSWTCSIVAGLYFAKQPVGSNFSQEGLRLVSIVFFWGPLPFVQVILWVLNLKGVKFT